MTVLNRLQSVYLRRMPTQFQTLGQRRKYINKKYLCSEVGPYFEIGVAVSQI
jgi:hypothetical protein